MKWPHKCRGEVISRVFTPPSDAKIKGRGVEVERMVAHVLYGYTTVIIVCRKCGQRRSWLETGDTTP